MRTVTALSYTGTNKSSKVEHESKDFWIVQKLSHQITFSTSKNVIVLPIFNFISSRKKYLAVCFFFNYEVHLDFCYNNGVRQVSAENNLFQLKWQEIAGPQLCMTPVVIKAIKLGFILYLAEVTCNSFCLTEK